MPIRLNTPEFGAYFQCHKNPLATYKVLESFRQFYPSNTIVLVSDNGYNYEGMAEKFNCAYLHCNENLVYIHRKMDDGSHVQHGMKLMKRIYDALLHVKEDYFMWLEDDVIINQKVIDNFRYDINGYCPHSFKKETLCELNKKYPFIEKDWDYRWSGHGGSIFNKQSFIGMAQCEDNAMDLLENWHKYHLLPDELPQDYFFSLLMIINKGSVGPYFGHADGVNNQIDKSIYVQHQYKKFYGDLLPDDKRYLITNPDL